MFRSSLDTSIKPILCPRKSGPDSATRYFVTYTSPRITSRQTISSTSSSMAPFNFLAHWFRRNCFCRSMCWRFRWLSATPLGALGRNATVFAALGFPMAYVDGHFSWFLQHIICLGRISSYHRILASTPERGKLAGIFGLFCSGLVLFFRPRVRRRVDGNFYRLGWHRGNTARLPGMQGAVVRFRGTRSAGVSFHAVSYLGWPTSCRQWAS